MTARPLQLESRTNTAIQNAVCSPRQAEAPLQLHLDERLCQQRYVQRCELKHGQGRTSSNQTVDK